MTETNNNGAHNPVADGYRREMSDFALALTGLAAAYVIAMKAGVHGAMMGSWGFTAWCVMMLFALVVGTFAAMGLVLALSHIVSDRTQKVFICLIAFSSVFFIPGTILESLNKLETTRAKISELEAPAESSVGT
ncbi:MULTISPECIES: hypothetical protein [Rhodobacterales]|uniref:Uncharacterized protein n=1 Tax=Allosediminivita pacifica TaxID=1267769 RepID=A0A2T6ADP2_9RHOB|nr:MULTISPECIES: hypothetical protein [Rhodobacterales]PTX41896.1 hypothetical protein C8N44_12663 [Allosediminivita pacifica]GGB29930.1 hypothetical protein GCM10011324_44290 [Allosediminivita pacifica]